MPKDDGIQLLQLEPSPFGDLLRAPGDKHYGLEDESAVPDEISIKGLLVRLGNRPLAKNLRSLYEKAHRELPSDLAVFDSYDLWLVPHSVGILRRHGSALVHAVGYEADFCDAEQVYTLDMLPQTKFVTLVEGSVQAEADIGIEGNAELPDAAKLFLEATESIGGDARLKLSAETKLLGRISLSVMSSVVQSIGIGKPKIEWKIDVDDRPLLGDQMLLQTIAVPAGTESLQFRAKAYALIKGNRFRFPAFFETGIVSVNCPLTPNR
jgi:hypothetical protein